MIDFDQNNVLLLGLDDSFDIAFELFESIIDFNLCVHCGFSEIDLGEKYYIIDNLYK